MPAPNAAALGKYGDIPIGYFTGVPQIGVPIYTIEEGPLSVPVSISYHASGVKVSEMASWVGMGWSLQAGGMVTRTTMGFPDENSPNGYWHNGANLVGNTTELLQIRNGQELDTEPDLFSFSMPGYTGKFFFDKDNNVHLVPRQEITVKWQESFEQFVLTAPDGTKCYFGKNPATGHKALDKTTPQGTANYTVSSWHLVRVESHDGKFHIDMTYVDENYAYYQLASCSYGEWGCTNGSGNGWGGGYSCFNSSSIWDAEHPTIRFDIQGKRLDEIACSTTSVKFYGTNELREDLRGHNTSGFSAYALDRIEISTGNYCSKFKFDYDYFHDLRTLGNYDIFEWEESKRLKLLSVQEIGCNGSDPKPPHTFTYHGSTMTKTISGESITRQFLPLRLSKATDHWGYYNGQGGNEDLLVNVPPTTLTNPSTGQAVTFGSANRDTYEAEMMRGALTKIDYPTGGHTTFGYEANSYNEINEEFSGVYELKNATWPQLSDICGLTSAESTYTFSATELANAVFTLTMTEPSPGCPSHFGPDLYLEVEAFNDQTGASLGKESFNAAYLTSVTTVPKDLTTFGGNNITAGTPIRFEMSARDCWGRFVISTTNQVNVNKDAGGLRIKQVTTHDGFDTANDIIKTYEYTDENNSLTTSGVRIYKPQYGASVNVFDGGTSVNYLIFNSSSFVPLGGFDGVEIAYKRVVEKHNGNGETVYNFRIVENTPPPQSPFVSSQFPLAPPQVIPWHGKLVDAAHFNGDGTEISKEVNQESVNPPTYAPGVVYKSLVSPVKCPIATDPANEVNVVFKTVYANYTHHYRLGSKAIKLDGVTTTTIYTYADYDDIYPETVEMINSDGKRFLTDYKYGDDYTPSSTVGNELVNRNMLLPAWQVENKVNGIVVDGTQTVYDFFNNSGLPGGATSDPIYPKEFYRFERTWDENGAITTGAWELQGSNLEYDIAVGKPKRFQQPGWEVEEFTWDVTNKMIKTRKFKDFTWTYNYHPGTKLLSEIIDIDGQDTDFEYDQLMRLKTVTARDGNIVKNYTYHFNDGTTGDRNYLKARTDYGNGQSAPYSELLWQESWHYLDGLGRGLQTVKRRHAPNSHHS
jgi:YD repeat-containing protein